jgi:hypothetical protein
MDQRELRVDHAEALRAAFNGFATEQWHCMPATIVSYDATSMEATAQSTIQIKVRAADGSQQLIAPVFTDVCVVFPAGGPFMVTWPLAPGDEVLVLFADRCIDNWRVNGGQQQQAELRLHSNSDGFAIPGPRSLPNVPASISGTDLQIRTVDGQTMIDITPAGLINILGQLGVNVTVGGTTFNVGPGGITVTGNIIVTGTVTADAFIVPPPV